MRVGRITALFLALVLAAGMAVASDTGAKKKTHRKAHVTSLVSLQAAGPDGFSGRVSGRGRRGKVCRGQRLVSIYRVNSGPSVPSNEFVTTTWTHGDGSWSLPGPQYPGQYFAVVEKKTIPRHKRSGAVICRYGASDGATWS